jgi:hypothetical protein
MDWGAFEERNVLNEIADFNENRFEKLPAGEDGLMGNLVYFCAGADKRVVSGKNIKALLLSVPNHARNERAIGKSLDLIKSSGAKAVMLDSGGYQLLKAQKKGWEIGFDKNAPIYQTGKIDLINLTPWHDVQAAMHLRPQSMIALDFPVKKIKERNEQEKAEVQC